MLSVPMGQAPSCVVQSILNTKGETSQIVDLVDLPGDFVANALYENNGKNADFNALREKVQSSDKLVFVVPEYNGSFPGILKTFIDGLTGNHQLEQVLPAGLLSSLVWTRSR